MLPGNALDPMTMLSLCVAGMIFFTFAAAQEIWNHRNDRPRPPRGGGAA